ncbi:OmpA family protein [Acidocella sp. KAb 2-4]|uniref:OmpA family protein n=1 Tax=Acidocella sp. KAb 2-4 TaxID=2885158 RepID=UPI001D09917B|nr:OmpA family protein [Acidocella sp. KAb 2-4]
MKHLSLLAGLLALAAPCAQAQVTVNPAALQQLSGIAPAPPAAPAPPRPVAAPRVIHHHAKPPAPPAAPAAAKPAPAAAPAPTPKPTAKPIAPVPKAPPAGVKLSFAPGSAALPANATAALGPFCGAGGMVSVSAHAPANPSDPSAAMRLSLARALAVKQALAACGVPAQNIIPRAMGASPGQADDNTIITAGAGTAQ